MEAHGRPPLRKLPRGKGECHQSARRAVLGSTRAARQPGTMLATRPTASRMAAALAITSGSRAEIPKSSDATSRLSPSAATIPSADADGNDPRAFAEDEADDVGQLRAECDADSHLVHALAHRVGDDAVDADRGDDEREDPERGEQRCAKAPRSELSLEHGSASSEFDGNDIRGKARLSSCAAMRLTAAMFRSLVRMIKSARSIECARLDRNVVLQRWLLDDMHAMNVSDDSDDGRTRSGALVHDEAFAERAFARPVGSRHGFAHDQRTAVHRSIGGVEITSGDEANARRSGNSLVRPQSCAAPRSPLNSGSESRSGRKNLHHRVAGHRRRRRVRDRFDARRAPQPLGDRGKRGCDLGGRWSVRRTMVSRTARDRRRSRGRACERCRGCERTARRR